MWRWTRCKPSFCRVWESPEPLFQNKPFATPTAPAALVPRARHGRFHPAQRVRTRRPQQCPPLSLRTARPGRSASMSEKQTHSPLTPAPPARPSTPQELRPESVRVRWRLLRGECARRRSTRRGPLETGVQSSVGGGTCADLAGAEGDTGRPLPTSSTPPRPWHGDGAVRRPTPRRAGERQTTHAGTPQHRRAAKKARSHHLNSLLLRSRALPTTSLLSCSLPPRPLEVRPP